MSGARIACRLFRKCIPFERAIMASTQVPCKSVRGNPGIFSPMCSVQLQGSLRDYSSKGRSQPASSSDDFSSSDSDDEKEKKRRRGQSEFWRRKMRSHHMALDVNNDGFVSWDDFELLILKFATLGNLKNNDLVEFKDAMKLVWEEEWGASGDPYAIIGQEQFLTNMEHVINTKELRKKVARPLPYFFKAVDTDHSGEISVEEFKVFYRCLGLSEKDAVESFNNIDVNKDGKISKKEFVTFGRDFFLNEDQLSGSQLFWGPLVN